MIPFYPVCYMGGDFSYSSYSDQLFALSLRQLPGLSVTTCCNIRRNHDNAEVDVDFENFDLGINDPDSNDEFSFDSTVTVTSGSSSASNLGEFVNASGYTDVDSIGGTTNGYVTIWYDQFGLSDFSQATANNQPRIINASALETDSEGNATMTTKNGLSAACRLIRDSDPSSSSDGTVYAVTDVTDGVNFPSSNWLIAFNSSVCRLMPNCTGGSARDASQYGTRLVGAMPSIHTWIMDKAATTYDARVDGSLQDDDISTTNVFIQTGNTVMGGSNSGGQINGIREILCFTVKHDSSTLSDIEGEINGYYSLY